MRISTVREFRDKAAGLLRVATRYEVIIYWSEEDKAFIAEVPELPGCAADGKTRREALKNVEVIIQEWIETARELVAPSLNPKAALSLPEESKPWYRKCWAHDCRRVSRRGK